jgi:putative adhesin
MRKALLATFLLLCAVPSGAATLTEKIDRTFDVRPGAKVVLSNVNGGIKISSWDQPRVRVIAEKEVHADSDDVKDVLRDLRVELQPRDGGLVITTHYPKHNDGGSILDWLLGDSVSREVTYELMVPRSMSVEVSNTNGTIRVSDVVGTHELETTNGRIEVSRCSGSLDASTTNGSIHAELVKVAKGQPLRFNTTNGGIEILVPSDLAADIDADTTNGSIRSDLPVSTTHTGRNSLRGTINGGGTSLRLRTTNGGIAIRRIQ